MNNKWSEFKEEISVNPANMVQRSIRIRKSYSPSFLFNFQWYNLILPREPTQSNTSHCLHLGKVNQHSLDFNENLILNKLTNQIFFLTLISRWKIDIQIQNILRFFSSHKYLICLWFHIFWDRNLVFFLGKVFLFIVKNLLGSPPPNRLYK